MKTNNSRILTTALLLIVCASACQAGKEPGNSAVNQPAAKTETNLKQPEVTTTPDKPPAGSLATPSEAYRTAYAARKNKDLEGVKRAFSKRLLEFLGAMGEIEKKTADDEIKELFDKPQASSDETRNEKITGETATLEYLDDDGKWDTMDFVKEGNDWKITIPTAKPGEVEGGTTKRK